MAVIICDIDDTLLRNGVQPIRSTIDWINAHQQYTIVLVTGRPQSQRAKTISALRSAGVKYNRLIMNPGSTADTAQYKEAVAKRLRNVVLAIDNNATMREAYKRAGVPKVVHPSNLTPGILKGIWNGSFIKRMV